MKRRGIKLFLGASVMALAAFLNVGPADAQSCDSLCNQINRACKAEAKAAKNIAFADCHLARIGCDVGCAADPNSCVVDCPAEYAACLATCDSDTACVAACDAALAACPDTCVGCCNYERASCLADAKAARRGARLACVDLRVTCPDTCVEPVDGDCVKTCKSATRSCKRTAKKDIWAPCKDQCPKGPSRRACMLGCSKELNVALESCSSTEGLSLQDCDDSPSP